MVSCFDDLSIELLYEILDYLSFIDLIQAFFGLNVTLNKTIQNYPMKIDLTLIIDQNFIQQNSFYCRSLILDQPAISNLNFTNLHAVTFKCMNFFNLQFLIEKLPIEQLQWITFRAFNGHNDTESIQQQVWSKIMTACYNCLRYLNLSEEISKWDIQQFQFNFPVLEYLILRHVSTNQALNLMHRTPNLRYCKIHPRGLMTDVSVTNLLLPKLNHLYLEISSYWSFEDFFRLFIICPHLKHLNLMFHILEHQESMAEALSWQTLIEQYLPNLIYLRLQFQVTGVFRNNTNPTWSLTSFNTNNYWLQRRPQFQVTIKLIKFIILDWR